jgi:hypothetical protein
MKNIVRDWRYPKMGVPQVTIGVNTQMVIHDLDDLIPPISGNSQMYISKIGSGCFMFVIGHHDPARNSRALPTMAVWYSSPAADLQNSWNSSIEIWNDIVCLVVWNMAFIVTYIYIHIGNNDPN